MPVFTPQLTELEITQAFQGVNIQNLRRLVPGGQGSLWRCNYQGQDSALKIYPLRGVIRTRVEREIDALESMSCDQIITLINHGEIRLRSEDCLFIVTNFIDGENLREILRRRRLSNNEVETLIIDISQAIETMWNKRIVHRDIKPENIMMFDDHFILIDLGIARFVDEPTVTPTGVGLGTLSYMSPEQALGRRGLTLHSDFFSLGIVAYELLTGIHPFSFRQDYIGVTDPPAITLPDVPEGLKNCIYALLNKKVYNRPNSLAEIQDLLGG